MRGWRRRPMMPKVRSASMSDADRLAALEAKVAALTDERNGYGKALTYDHGELLKAEAKVAALEAVCLRLTEPFQPRVQPWLVACFGAEIAGDRIERNHRFIEEALELVQAL